MQQALEAAMSELVLGPALGADEIESFLARHAFSPEDRAALRESFERLLVYRTLVRSTLRGAVDLAIPRTIARLGAVFDEYFDLYLAEHGPRTHYLRDVTTELLDFCAPRWAVDGRVPAWAHELARHEALQIVVASLREPAVPRELGELELEQGLCFAPATRIVRYEHAVHRVSEDPADKTPPERGRTALFVYRDAEHDVRYLELTPVAAALLDRLRGGASLKDALLGACSETATEPASVLDGTARLLADLAARGVLLGAAPRKPASEMLRGETESSTMARSGREKEPHERS